MGQVVEAPVSRPADLSLIPGIHMLEKKNQVPHTTLWPPHVPGNVREYTQKKEMQGAKWTLSFLYFPNFLPNTYIIFIIEEKTLQGWGDRSGMVEEEPKEQMDRILGTTRQAYQEV